MKNYTKAIVLSLLNSENLYLSAQDLLLAAEVSKEEEDFFIMQVQDLVHENVLGMKKDGYVLLQQGNRIFGTFHGHQNGFGFVDQHDSTESFFVYNDNLYGALDGDFVCAKIIRQPRRGKKGEVDIKRILFSKRDTFLGVFKKKEGSKNGTFEFDNPRIGQVAFVSRNNIGNALDGEKVAVEIVTRAQRKKELAVRVVSTLGPADAVGMDILSIIHEYDVNQTFSPETLKEVERITEESVQQDIARRKDLRNEMVITIDGSDAKDLDDAVQVKRLDNGNFLLGVHIADVSHYVTPGSSLDDEAKGRATSIYLVDRVIPMLPKELSNGICSLHPNVDRLTLSVDMELDKHGNLKSYDIYESVINSHKRMTYTDVATLIDGGDEALEQEHADILPMVKDMATVSKALIKKRFDRGSIDFDLRESKVKLDDYGVPVDIVAYDRNVATELIESFMVLANETVSQHFTNLKIPFVYRVHQAPDPERTNAFQYFLTQFGDFPMYSIEKPKDVQNLMEELKDEPFFKATQTMLLRSLKKARYSEKNVGHFGLASREYSHFTSPIRRYPDLQIHRITKAWLNKNLDMNTLSELEDENALVSEVSSKQEVNATKMERDSVALKKAEYMEKHIGEQYEGIITGVVANGVFVQLENTVEGFLHKSKLRDTDFIFEPDFFYLEGVTSHKKYMIGDVLDVVVDRVSVSKRQVDFALPALVENELSDETVEEGVLEL